MEILYIMRNCKSYEKEYTGADAKPLIVAHFFVAHSTIASTTGWGHCYSGAADNVYWHLRACCVDNEFFKDHTESECFHAIKLPLMDIRQNLIPRFKSCTGYGDNLARHEDECDKTESHLVRIIERLHTAARIMYKANPRDVTHAAKEFIAITHEDTLKHVESFLRANGGQVPNDGEPCDGC